MEGFLNLLADYYIILIIITLIIILALIGYNSIKNDDFVIQNNMRSNKKPELEDLKQGVEGKSINDSLNKTMTNLNLKDNLNMPNTLGSTPTYNGESNNEIEKL